MPRWCGCSTPSSKRASGRGPGRATPRPHTPPPTGRNRRGFHSDNMRQWEQAISTPYGMILVTGPTGSGKTTTLYATLGTINTLEKNIVTVEDPVEYQLPRINQVQVNVKAGLTFAYALRST